jgi:hypothetical protein
VREDLHNPEWQRTKKAHGWGAEVGSGMRQYSEATLVQTIRAALLMGLIQRPESLGTSHKYHTMRANRIGELDPFIAIIIKLGWFTRFVLTNSEPLAGTL